MTTYLISLVGTKDTQPVQLTESLGVASSLLVRFHTGKVFSSMEGVIGEITGYRLTSFDADGLAVKDKTFALQEINNKIEEFGGYRNK